MTIPNTANALNFLNLDVVLNINIAWARKGHVTAIEQLNLPTQPQLVWTPTFHKNLPQVIEL
ncbi:hypothetical protein O9992_05235 [Vibrio lentus]|nr:hypothetical protein [Vibrio lentus]